MQRNSALGQAGGQMIKSMSCNSLSTMSGHSRQGSVSSCSSDNTPNLEHCGLHVQEYMDKFLQEANDHDNIKEHPSRYSPLKKHKTRHHRHRSCPAFGANMEPIDENNVSSPSRSRHHTRQRSECSHCHGTGVTEADGFQQPARHTHHGGGRRENKPARGQESRFAGRDLTCHDIPHDPSSNKFFPYTKAPDGYFPHPFDAKKKGLPFMQTLEIEREGLPDSFLKPLNNTSPMHYNHFREHNDSYEHRQRELNYFVKAQHKHNKEMAKLLNPTSNSQSRIFYMHATTKPLGRLYFDNHTPQYQFSDHHVKQILPADYERRQYDFWR